MSRHRRIALDTNVFIFSLDVNPRYAVLSREVFAWVAQRGHAAVTSSLTMTEILVKPYRSVAEGDVRKTYDLLLTYPNLGWIAPDLEISDLAARLRAKYKLETPDAIQAATAILSGATLLVTNDASFEKIPAFETLLLDRLL